MHIHILNDRSAPEALRLSVERLARQLQQANAGPADLQITEGFDLEDADILFSCRKMDIGAAKAAMPSLKWVQVISAGVEAMIPTLPDDVVLTNASGVHGEKGGEFVLAAALMLNYRIPSFVTAKADRAWKPVFATPARGKRVTLLGLGGIGGQAAVALRSRGFVVTGVTRSGRHTDDVDASLPIDRIDSVLPDTDILVSTLPLTNETRHLFDRDRLSRLPGHAGIIIVGRADVFDYGALADLLTQGRLGGAVLDVYPVEPLPAEDRLWSCPNLIMTPHCSVDDHETYMSGCLDIFIDNVARFGRAAPLRNLIDRERGY